MCGVLIDLTSTSVMDKTGETSHATLANEVDPIIPNPAS